MQTMLAAITPTSDSSNNNDDAHFKLHGWSLVWTTVALTMLFIGFLAATAYYCFVNSKYYHNTIGETHVTQHNRGSGSHIDDVKYITLPSSEPQHSTLSSSQFERHQQQS